MAFLKKLEEYTVERMTLRTKERLASQGLANVQVDFTAESTYVEIGARKLAVIRLHDGSDASRQVVIAGVVGAELKRVWCVRRSPENIPVTSGVCGERVEEVFGIKFHQ